MFRPLLTRLAALTALTVTSAYAQSGCTALYATINYGTAAAPLVAIDYVNTTTKTSTQVYDQTLAVAGITNINAAGLNPVNGQVYFIDRSVTGRNDLYAFNPVTRTSTFKGAVTPPANANGVAIGGTFDSTSGTARYYMLYGNYAVQEVNPETGAVLRTITVAFPTTDAQGATLARRTNANGVATSGDIVFDGTTAYAVLDGIGGGANLAYWVNLGALSSTTGSGTLTPTPANIRRILDAGGAPIPMGAVNGAAITPYGETFISYTTNTTSYNLASLNTTGATSVNVTTVTTNGTRAYTDLSDCTVLPATPTLTKAFSTAPVTAPVTIRTGQNATLTLTLSSTNPSPSYTQATLTDSLPAGVTVASTPNASTTCVNSEGNATGVTATAGSGSVVLAASTRVPQSGNTCTVTVSVTGTTRGLKTNTIPAGSLQSTAGTYNTAATATLLVNDPITGTNVKRQRLYPTGTLTTAAINAKPNDLVEYCITSTHPGVGYAPATVANVSDLLSSNLRFVTGSATQGYGVNRDLKITRNGGAPTYRTYGAAVSGQQLTVSVLPFSSTDNTAEVCFVAQVK